MGTRIVATEAIGVTGKNIFVGLIRNHFKCKVCRSIPLPKATGVLIMKEFR
jgi:hypothetical protein